MMGPLFWYLEESGAMFRAMIRAINKSIKSHPST